MERTLPEWLHHIQTEWSLSSAQMAALTHCSVDAYEGWLGLQDSQATIPAGMDSAVPLVSIYRRLSALHPATDDQVKWLFTRHADFGENQPIDVAASSLENLSWVSYWLETTAALRQ